LIDVFALRIALINVFLFAGYLALCSVICTSCGFYRSHRLSRRSRRVVESLVAATLMAAIIFALRRPFNLSFATDMFLILFWGLTCTSLAVFHLIAQQLLYYARSHGRNLRGIVIVGEGQEAAALADRIGKDTALGYRVLRIIDAKEVGER
jgi:FlaA1/EpsC-like NDP-sugar epimerase